MIDLPFLCLDCSIFNPTYYSGILVWDKLLAQGWLFYIITNIVLFCGYFSVRCDALNSWKCDKPHSVCNQIRIQTMHITALGKKGATSTDAWDYRDGFTCCWVLECDSPCNRTYRYVQLEVWCFCCIDSSEASTSLSIVPVWTGASEPYPAFAEMNWVRPNCYK